MACALVCSALAGWTAPRQAQAAPAWADDRGQGSQIDPMESENTLPTSGNGRSSSGSSGSTGTSGGAKSGGSRTTTTGSSGSATTSTAATSSATAVTHDKVGRFIANAKLGAVICVYSCVHQGAAALEFGWSLLPNKHGYVLLSVQTHFAGSAAAVSIPLGFQYDLPIPIVSGLFFYPRASLGYAAILALGPGPVTTMHAGVFIPEAGIKYVLSGRYNFCLDFLSFPMFFGQTSFGGFFSTSYRALLYAGLNF